MEKTDVYGYKLIHYVCYLRNVEIVKSIIDKVDLEATTLRGLRPIHIACYHGHPDIDKLLVDGFISDEFYSIPSKVNLRCLTRDGLSPLDLTKKSEILEFLKKKLEIESRILVIKKNFFDIDIIVVK